MTMHDFVRKHKVEVTIDEKDVYNCFIDYKKGDVPWGQGTNILEAIDNGVANYLKKFASPQPLPHSSKKASDELRLFLSKDALFIWYFYAKQYGVKKIVDHYEAIAAQKSPTYLNALRFMYKTILEVIDNPSLELSKDYAAINNVFIQALVYYESVKIQKYENNALIRDMVQKLDPDNRDAFYAIQSTIEKIDSEMQDLLNQEDNG